MIVEAAIRSGATILYTEDLHHGTQYGPLHIQNPSSSPQICKISGIIAIEVSPIPLHPHLLLASLLLTAATTLAQTPHRTVALTFDDLPAVDTNESADQATEVRTINLTLLNALDRAHAPTTAFVIGTIADETPQSRPMLEEWKRRGYTIGNHTFTHPSFDDLTVPQEEQEILKGEHAIQPLLAPGVKYMRFPYNATGDTAAKHAAILDFLRQHNYQLATCTIENEDYEFARAYAVMLARHDKASEKKLIAAYLAYTSAEIDLYDSLHRQLFGHEIPNVMLLHASHLNADTLPRILALFTRKGYRFVSLAQAQSDPAYATPDTFITSHGPMWAYRWAHVLGVKFTGPRETEPPAWVLQYGK